MRPLFVRFAHPILIPLTALCLACGPASGPPALSSGAATVDTSAPSVTFAGAPFAVTCHFYDDAGDPRPLPDGVASELVVEPAGALMETDGGLYMATDAGSFTVACSTDGGTLVDLEPAEVLVGHGPAAFSVTTLDTNSVEAGGDAVTASCEVYDAYGNPVDDATPTLAVSPTGYGAITGLSARFERADRYTLSCAVPGAQADGAVLTVLPSLPEQLLLAVDPERPFHAREDTVAVEHQALDRFGNLVPDVSVSYDIGGTTGLRALGAGEFFLAEDGAHTVAVTVDSATADDRMLRASVELLVSGAGPAVTCDANRYREVAAGESVVFSGRVADPNGVAELLVNGQSVSVAEDGGFVATITPDYGMNFVEIVANDAVGASTSRACPLVAADRYASATTPLPGVVSAMLGGAAINDFDRTGPIGSIADIMQIVLGSTGVEDTADEFLAATGELLPPSCITRILGICIQARADYAGGFAINGEADAAMEAADGGLAVALTLRDLDLDLDIDVFDIISINDLTVHLESLSLEMILDTYLVGNVATLTVRPGSLVTTNAGTLTADGSWVPEFLLDPVISWIQEDIRGVIVARLEFYLPAILVEVVNDLFGTIDVNALDVEIVVPKLDGGDPYVLTPSFELSALDTTPDRLRLGIATMMDAAPVHAHTNPGIPLPTGDHFLDGAPVSPMEVGISAAIVNQAVNALWRAGFLQLDGAALLGADLPDGYAIDIEGTMPPIARLRDDGQIEIGIGGLLAAISLPGIFGEPLIAEAGAIATTGLSLNGETLSVDDIVIEDIFFSVDGVDLDAQQRATLEQALTDIVRVVVESLLTDALPRLPIPSLPLPPAFEVYGLPANTDVGVIDGVLTHRGEHLYLTAQFGEK